MNSISFNVSCTYYTALVMISTECQLCFITYLVCYLCYFVGSFTNSYCRVFIYEYFHNYRATYFQLCVRIYYVARSDVGPVKQCMSLTMKLFWLDTSLIHHCLQIKDNLTVYLIQIPPMKIEEYYSTCNRILFG